MTAPSILSRSVTRRVTALGSVVLAIAGCAAAGGDLGTVAPAQGSSEPSIAVQSTEPTPVSSEPAATPGATASYTTTLRTYFMLGSLTGDSGLVPVLRSVPATSAVGRAAMTALLAGPQGKELEGRPAMYTGIPDGATFLGLDILDGTAFVNFSSEFDAGGTSATLPQRYAQVVYTLTQFPTITGVIFEIDGEQTPAVVPGGAVVDQFTPITRDFYDALLPAIWVDRPSWGGVLPSGSLVSGSANVFEAQFRLRVLDASGHAVTDIPVAAKCGTGCRGTFEVKIAYGVKTAQWGTLRVFEPAAKDGSPTHVVDYPVWLTPS
jgi:germination protein M